MVHETVHLCHARCHLIAGLSSFMSCYEFMECVKLDEHASLITIPLKYLRLCKLMKSKGTNLCYVVRVASKVSKVHLCYK